MDIESLLKIFLGAFPNSTHPFDQERFLKYAIACAIEGRTIDSQTMLDAGVFPENVERYEVAYSWIRNTVEFIFNHLNPNDFSKFEDSLR